MKIENKLVFRLAAVLGLVGMIAGTAGSHGIKFETPYLEKIFFIGQNFLFFHIPVLMILAVLGISKQAYLMLGGIVLFTIPLMTKGMGVFSGGIIVPTGGMMVMAAWVWLIFVGKSEKKEE